MIGRNNHLVSINDVEIEKLLDFAYSIEFNLYEKLSCEGKILANLFYEPSTRTSSSFASAMYRLGGDVISINDVNYSSVSKGENLQDTIRTMSNYCDIIVLRSAMAGNCATAARVSEVPIINAGDGNGEHPTQTLLDLYTIWKKFDRIKDLRVTFVGDIENGRTVHSLAKALEGNCELNYCETYEVDELPESDVYYLTRVQRERGSTGTYELTERIVRWMPEDCIVLHPFPRNEEIPVWFDDDPRAKYFEQMKNGLYIRMALLHKYI